MVLITSNSMQALPKWWPIGMPKPWALPWLVIGVLKQGAKTGHLNYLVKNKIKLVITSALKPNTSDVASFVTTHGDGVKRFSVVVDNVEKAFNRAVQHGAITVQKPHRTEDPHGTVEEAFIRIYDDTELGFINTDHYKGLFKPSFYKPLQNFLF